MIIAKMQKKWCTCCIWWHNVLSSQIMSSSMTEKIELMILSFIKNSLRQRVYCNIRRTNYVQGWPAETMFHFLLSVKFQILIYFWMYLYRLSESDTVSCTCDLTVVWTELWLYHFGNSLSSCSILWVSSWDFFSKNKHKQSVYIFEPADNSMHVEGEPGLLTLSGTECEHW